METNSKISQNRLWNIKLKVNFEEESLIKKEAIDYHMGLAEFIKDKLLDRLPKNKKHESQKTV
ncbi:MAG: hypothetical protein ACFBSE_11250 [Prochloraceae cyanobacterium]